MTWEYSLYCLIELFEGVLTLALCIHLFKKVYRHSLACQVLFATIMKSSLEHTYN